MCAKGRCTCVCAHRSCVCTHRPCMCAHRRASPLTCLAVCFLVLTYNLLGGFLFLALEGASDSETAVAASTPQLGSPLELRARTVERLWAITEDLNILYKDNWTRLAARELSDFQAALAESLHAPSVGERHQRHYRWTFATSFLYALTLITTIGDGEMTPQSTAGKLVALGYACVGIPLVLVYLSTAGGALARGVRGGWARVRPPAPPPPTPPLGHRQRLSLFEAALTLQKSRPVPWQCRAPPRVPAPLPLLLLVLYVSLGAIVFHITERWSLLDGCYFAFSTLATVGFGGMRPGQSAVSARAEDIAIGVCCIYILVGVVVVATCFRLVQEELRAALRGVAGLCGGGNGETVHTAPTPVDTHTHTLTQSEKPPDAVS